MVRTSVKTIQYTRGSGSYKTARSRQLVNKAAQLLRSRMAGASRAPLRTRGFYGTYTRRGRDELKVIDSGPITGNNPSAGGLTLLNGVSSGTDYTARIGRRTVMKSILFRFYLVPNISATNGALGDVVRMMLVYDCQSNAAAPAVGDILAGGAPTFDSPMNLNNRDRFKILADKYYTIGSWLYTGTSLTAGSPRPVAAKIYKKMNLEVIFGGTGSTVGSIQTGAVYCLLISLNNSISTSVFNSRIRFIDS